MSELGMLTVYTPIRKVESVSDPKRTLAARLELLTTWKRTIQVTLLLYTLLATTACMALTREEAADALDEAKMLSAAATMIGVTERWSENFTIGEGAAAGLENIRSFYESQLACADVNLSNSKLIVEYGVNGDCLYQGMRFTGTHEITLTINSASEVVVDHSWINLSNGMMSVDGTATVSWKGGEDPSRDVTHDLSWIRLEDKREASSTGHRVQKPLSGGIEEGFSVSGNVEWRGESGAWELEIGDVEMRWVDTVPQAGSYILETPYAKTLSLEFIRTKPTMISVEVSSGARSFDIEVATPE